MGVTAWVIALGCSVLCNAYLLWGIKIYYEKGKEDGKNEALKQKLPPRAICHTAQIIRFSVATRVDPEEGRHFPPKELKERVRRRLAEEASERIMNFAMVETSEEECIIGKIETIKAHFAIADMSGFGEPYFKEEK